jgi:hypothetical protein
MKPLVQSERMLSTCSCSLFWGITSFISASSSFLLYISSEYWDSKDFLGWKLLMLLLQGSEVTLGGCIKSKPTVFCSHWMLLHIENESISNLKEEAGYDTPGKVINDDGIGGAWRPKEVWAVEAQPKKWGSKMLGHIFNSNYYYFETSGSYR